MLFSGSYTLSDLISSPAEHFKDGAFSVKSMTYTASEYCDYVTATETIWNCDFIRRSQCSSPGITVTLVEFMVSNQADIHWYWMRTPLYLSENQTGVKIFKLVLCVLLKLMLHKVKKKKSSELYCAFSLFRFNVSNFYFYGIVQLNLS